MSDRLLAFIQAIEQVVQAWAPEVGNGVELAGILALEVVNPDRLFAHPLLSDGGVGIKFEHGVAHVVDDLLVDPCGIPIKHAAAGFGEIQLFAQGLAQCQADFDIVDQARGQVRIGEGRRDIQHVMSR
ncbi:hypothetical protein D3C75_914190 [compost metagenome]